MGFTVADVEGFYRDMSVKGVLFIVLEGVVAFFEVKSCGPVADFVLSRLWTASTRNIGNSPRSRKRSAAGSYTQYSAFALSDPVRS